MHSIKANFDKVLGVLRQMVGEEVTPEGNFIRSGPRPRFTDLEVIALSLTAEALSIDSESLLFCKISTDYEEQFPNMISRRQYNDRRKHLFKWQELLRSRMAHKINEVNEVYAIDSMPLEICKLARAARNKMGKQEYITAPDKGYCASQDKYFFGYKLHGVCSPSGVIQAMDLTQASVHDIHFLQDVKGSFKDCTITGDKGYISKQIKEDLWNTSNICLEVPARSNQKDAKPVMYVLKKIRKRIETVFSQLCDHFMIQRNYAKTLLGYKTRILAKVSSMTILQYINKFITGRPVGQIKYALR